MTEVIAEARKRIPLGRVGENNATVVVWKGVLTQWRADHGEGHVQLLARRTGDAAPYPVAVEVDGDSVRWVITEADVARPGFGAVELSWWVDGTVAKSVMYNTVTYASMSDGTTYPPESAWIDRVLATSNEATDAAAEAAASAGEAAASAGEAAASAGEAAASAGEAAASAGEAEMAIKVIAGYPIARITCGSYTGTGSDGKETPNTLSFNFKPQLVFITSEKEPTAYNSIPVYYILMRPLPRMNLVLNHDGVVTWGDKSVTWYNDKDYQLNSSGVTYYYIAIGEGGDDA